MLFSRHAHWSLIVQLHPVVRIVTVRPVPFSGVAIPMKLSPPAVCINWPARRSSLARGELALPLSGGSRQPLDRQLSYYREHMRLASDFRSYPSHPGTPKYPKRKNATPNRVAFHDLALSLASQIIRGRLASLPYLLQATLAGLPLLRSASLADARAGCLFFFGLVRSLPAPVNHWRLSSSNYGSNHGSLFFQ
jgi:hypothetical protein